MKTPDTSPDDRATSSGYVFLAKAALWLTSMTLLGVVVGGVYTVVHGDTSLVSSVVSACQVLSLIAITVLGYHGYQGRRMFQDLRNFNPPS